MLRDYQIDLIQKIFKAWENNRSVVAQLPTGGGKSVILSAVVNYFINRGGKALILAHRAELITQAAGHLYRATAIECGIIKCGVKPNYNAPIQVASVQSMSPSRMYGLPDFELIVVDECHHAVSTSYRRILNNYPNAKILGVTATPQRLDGKGLGIIFDDLVVGVDVPTLIDHGYLSKYRYYEPEEIMNIDNLKSIHGEYSVASIEAENPHQNVAALCLRAYDTYLVGKQSIVFASSVQQSEAIVEAFKLAGVSADHLDGSSKDRDRLSVMAAFKDSQINVLSNCALFDEGLDIPGLDAVVMARPTKSLTKYLQQIGRSLRIAEGKTHAIIIDLCKNYETHGLPNESREWSLESKEKKKTNKKFTKREDGEIEEIFLELPEIKPIKDSRNFVEVTENLLSVELSILKNLTQDQLLNIDSVNKWLADVKQIIDIKTQNSYQPGWMIHQLKKLNAPLLAYEAMASYMGYKKGWAQYHYKNSPVRRQSA